MLEDLPKQIPQMKIVDRSELDRLILASPTHRAVVRLDFNQQAQRWLMTAFEP